jgi:hypothetical protein
MGRVTLTRFRWPSWLRSLRRFRSYQGFSRTLRLLWSFPISKAQGSLVTPLFSLLPPLLLSIPLLLFSSYYSCCSLFPIPTSVRAGR